MKLYPVEAVLVDLPGVETPLAEVKVVTHLALEPGKRQLEHIVKMGALV